MWGTAERLAPRAHCCLSYDFCSDFCSLRRD
nr:MAG TPA: hypothetical protein [Caudoviricetes sp.]